MFDGRGDNDAMYHQYNVNMRNVYDIQVLFTLKFSDWNDRYVKGLAKVMDRYATHLSNMERQRLNEIKDKGKRLFVPDLGGSYEVWEHRPLSVELIEYASGDVKHLLAMKKKWGSPKNERRIVEITMKRIEKAVRATEACRGKYKARRDF